MYIVKSGEFEVTHDKKWPHRQHDLSKLNVYEGFVKRNVGRLNVDKAAIDLHEDAAKHHSNPGPKGNIQSIFANRDTS